MFTLKKTSLSGCFELTPSIHRDHRGTFTKVFQKEFFEKSQLDCDFTEQYHSLSNLGVLRGLHFQAPPFDHVKLVYCLEGSVQDVVLDIRISSPTYGKFYISELSADTANMIYIPRGLAHGFLATSKTALLVYNVTKSYSQAHDNGIRWDSVGIPWKIVNPIISSRDSEFVAFDKFVSPFKGSGFPFESHPHVYTTERDHSRINPNQ